MTDVALTSRGTGQFGVSLNLAGAQCVGTVAGSWVTPIDHAVIDGIAVHYHEAGGGMSQAVLTAQVLIGNDSTTIYQVNIGALGAWTYTITTSDSDPYIPLWPFSAAAGVRIGGCVTAIRATAVITGTGAGADALRVTFLGRRLGYA